MDFYCAETEDESQEAASIANNIGCIKVTQKDHAAARTWHDLVLRITAPSGGACNHLVTVIQPTLGQAAFAELNREVAIDWGMKAMPDLRAKRAQTQDDQRRVFELLGHGFAARGDVNRAIFFGKIAVNAHQAFRAGNTITGGGAVADSHCKWGRSPKELADLMSAQGRIFEARAVLNMAK